MSQRTALSGPIRAYLDELKKGIIQTLGLTNPELVHTRLKRIVGIVTALLAGGFTHFLTGLFPYYPDEWRWLVAAAVVALWVFKATNGVALALVVFLLPITYTSLTLALVFIVFLTCVAIVEIWALGPYGFLVLAGTTVVVLQPNLAILLLAAPIVAGFLGPRRGAVLGGIACFWAQALALLRGQADVGLLAVGPRTPPMITANPKPVSSLLDFSWLSIQGEKGSLDTDLISRLFAPFLEQPVLLVQVGLWILAACGVGMLLSRSFVKRLPSRYSAVLAGVLILGAGYSTLYAFFGGDGLDIGAIARAILVPGVLVAVAAPLLEMVVSAINTPVPATPQPGETTAGEDYSSHAGSDWTDAYGLRGERGIEEPFIDPYPEREKGPAHDVFISYSSKDKPIADAVCACLESNHIRCWMAPRDILPGSDFGLELAKAIKTCKVMVLIYTAHSNTSKYVLKEVERAVNNDIPIVPFRMEDIPLSESMGFFLGNLQWLDATTPPLGQHLGKLTETISQLLNERVG